MNGITGTSTDVKLQEALEYAAFGWRVVITHGIVDGKCTCGNADCGVKNKSAGKHPRQRAWQKAATTDDRELVRLFERHPQSNVGVLLGPDSGIVDFETDDEEGEKLFAEMFGGEIPRTPTYTSDRGKHHLFQWRDEFPAKASIPLGCGDIKLGAGKLGSQSIFPPSNHYSGKSYRWLIPPSDAAPAPVPDCVIEYLARREQEKNAPSTSSTSTVTTSIATTVPSAATFVPSVEQIIDKAERTSDKFARLWRGDVGGYHSASSADFALVSIIAFYAGPHEHVIDAIFRQSGLMRPKWDTTRGTTTYGKLTIGKVLAKRTEFYTWKSKPKYKRTDYGNAERFRDEHGSVARFCHAWDKWVLFDSKRWGEDKTGGVMRLAKRTTRRMWRELKDITDRDEQDKFLRFIRSSESATKLAAMLKLAQDELPITPDEMDRDVWLLNCTNGTVDLRTGTLRPHRREDYITRLCPTAYDPDAGSYHFDKFIDAIFDGRQAVVDFMQRYCGYVLTGDVREQVLGIFYGSGSNGKSTLLNAIMETIGADYAMQGTNDLLLAKTHEGHPVEKADLFGRRLVCCVETGDGRRLDEPLVKQLTGGDKVRARRLYENLWEFAPTHKLVMCTNHMPQVKGSDHGIWRRLVLVPFSVRFWNPDKHETGDEHLRQDKSLADKLRAEAPGILAWMVRGCLDWQRSGLAVPDEVRAATSDYQANEDVLAAYLAECCIVNKTTTERASNLYSAFKLWCDETGEPRISQKRWGAAMSERNFESYKNNGVVYRGLTLNAQWTGRIQAKH